jgi:hypothetical protein
MPCESSVNGFCILIEAHAPQAALSKGVDILAECNL